MPLQIIRNDITKVTADAIVNTANPEPIIGGGTDQAIYTAAGEKQLLAARQKIGDINPGEARVTPAFDLDAKIIIHTVGPVWEDGKNGEIGVLWNCYLNSLELASQYKCKSVAFPLIATGVYGFPKDKALKVATDAINGFLETHEMDVYLVVFDQDSFEVTSEKFDKIKEYVDAEYAKIAYKAEYKLTDEEFIEWEKRRNRELLRIERMMKSNNHHGIAQLEEAKKSLMLKDADIKKMYDSKHETFRNKYLSIIKERGVDPSSVYNGYYDRRIYNKMTKNEKYHPSKGMAIIMCLSLHLNLSETFELMSYASLTLNPTFAPDIIIMDCILHGKYKMMDINCALEENGLPSFDQIY